MSDRYEGFAVTGSPVLHSKSPLIFNTVFQSSQTTSGKKFIYNRLAATSARDAVALFRRLNLKAMNVTAPFKQEIMDHLNLVDVAAARIGGVNLVVRKDDGLIGYNTDYIGVVKSISAQGIDVAKKECIVLGAGGAGRAAAFGLIRSGADVILVNRTYSTAVNFAKALGCRAEPIDTLQNLLKSAHILVSTLPAGVDIVPAAWLQPQMVVFEANYHQSPLSENATSQGCTLIKGEEWLLNQAIPAFSYFTGFPPNADDAESMKKSLQNAETPVPNNIALIGFMGSGKSVAGGLLARKLGLPYRDIDYLIESREKMSIPAIFKQKGEAYFRKVEKAILKEQMESNVGIVYSCGGGVVEDEENIACLKQNALVIWLHSTVETALKRITPGSRPLLEGDDPVATAEEIFHRRSFHYAQASHLIADSEPPIQQVVEKIYDEIDKTFSN